MTRHYYVHPDAQAFSPLRPEDEGITWAGPYTEGKPATLPAISQPPNGRSVSRVTHAPQWNLYLATEDNMPRPTPDAYYIYDQDRAYQADADPALIRVQETNTNAQIPIDELQDLKLIDLANKVRSVLDQGVVVTAVGADMRSDIEYRQLYNAQQQSTLPDATTTRLADLWGDWIAVTKLQCSDVHTALFLLDAQALGQAEVHEDEINRLTGADDWAGLSAYDPTTGFPAAPSPPTQAQTERARNGHVKRLHDFVTFVRR